MWPIAKILISAVIITAVSEVGSRSPRLGAVLLTLPIISIIAFVLLWFDERSVAPVARLSRETLVLVPLGLPFFLPLAFSERLGLTFWPAFISGVLLAGLTIGSWLTFGPRSL